MKWFSNLLRKSRTQPPPSIQAKQTTPPREDPEGLRGQLAHASGDEQRAQWAMRLGHALAELGQAPRPDDPPDVHVAAVCHAQDKTRALHWLAHIKQEASLAAVAIKAQGGEVRLAAAQRLESDMELERVALASRNKDKRVHRHCADLLRQRRANEASARRAGEIADQLRTLLGTAPQSLSRLMEMKQALGELSDSPAATECAALLETAFACLRTETEAQRHLHSQLQAAKQLQAECAQAAWPWSGHLADWQGRLDTLNQDAARHPAWLTLQVQALTALLAGIESRLAEMTGEEACVADCEQCLATLEADRPEEADARARWQALPKPRQAEVRQALEARWKTLCASQYPQQAAPAEPAPAAIARPAPPPGPKPDQTALRALLDRLEQAIGTGHLGDAEETARQIRPLTTGKELPADMESRWHRLQAELETLRGWARWGTQQAREKLIADAEALLIGEHAVEALAQAIPALRAEWKRLNAHAPAGKAQWESFDTTLEKAYAPVAALRAEQAAHQAEARAFKEALCVQWEADTTWQQADFKAVEAHRADLIRQWHAAPQTGFRDERTLRKRFDALIEVLDRHLDAARSAEKARREQIIQAAEALAGEADTRRAIAEAKALQQSWSQAGAGTRLKRGDEQKLWQRFRTACDIVFARLDAQRAEQAAERALRTEARQKHLDEFASVLAGTDTQPIREAMARFQAAWDSARPGGRERGEPQPDRMESQARALMEQARQRLGELRHAQAQAGYDILARKSDLAERIEAAVLAGQPIDTLVAEIREAWAALPELPGKREHLLAQRLSGARDITAAALAAGQETRETLLLDLEIALGLPSPDCYADIRRERQLVRLQSRFGPSVQRTSEPEDMLARWYATPAPSNPASTSRITAIVRHLATRTATG